MLRQSYDNYIEKEHNKLYQAVTQGHLFYSIISCLRDVFLNDAA